MTNAVFPDFVVAGAARAGTTAVVESLRRHPGVFITQPKEPHYLALGDSPARFTGPGDDITINAVAVTDHRAYERLFAAAPAHALTGEGSVSTLYHHEAAVPRLLRLNPAVKVVVLLREPVARAYSSHQYLMNRGFETVADFPEAVSREAQRRAAGWHHLWHYTAMSRYAAAVRHLLEALPSEQVGVWWHDDLLRVEEDTLARIHAFLGLSPTPAGQLSVGRVNASGRPQRTWQQAAMHASGRMPALKRVVKAVVPFDTRERIRRSNLAVNDVPPEIVRELAPRFRSDLDEVEQILDRPVPASWRW